MKKTIEVWRTLGAFQVSVGSLRALADDIAELFEGRGVVPTITVRRPNETLEFNGLEELESYSGALPSTVPFAIRWHDVERANICALSARGTVSAYATSASGAWSASAIAVLGKHVRENRRWYGFLRWWHFPLLALALNAAPFIQLLTGHIGTSTAGSVAWLSLLALCWAMFFSYERTFPLQTLAVRREENLLRRYQPELTFLLALVSLLVSILALVNGSA